MESILTYKDTLRIIEEFAGRSLDFDTITCEWLWQFEKYLLQIKNLTTVGIHCRNSELSSTRRVVRG